MRLKFLTWAKSLSHIGKGERNIDFETINSKIKLKRSDADLENFTVKRTF